MKVNYDAARQATRDELRPIVREAITQDVMDAISKLVNLTPTMVDAIAEDLESSDKTLRQRAYSLLARYTLGNPSVAPQPETPDQAPMQVTFHLPRPGDASPTPVALETVDLRECVECKEHKMEADFVGASDRCQDCHDKMIAGVQARFADEAADGAD